jgi:hypothetical protein
MTENEIKLLGFKKNNVSIEESGDKPYHYYIYEITKGLEFISSDSDTSSDNEWFIEFFNTEIPVRFYKMGEVQSLINIFENSKVITK